jgi:hypothetical protein
MYEQTVYLLELCIHPISCNPRHSFDRWIPYEQMINSKVDLRRTSADRRKRHKHLMDQCASARKANLHGPSSCRGAIKGVAPIK